jgi:hypothetical protein
MFVPTHELAPTEVYVMKLASGEVGAYAAPRRQLSRAPSPRLESCPPRRQLSYAHRWLGANFLCRLENPEKTALRYARCEVGDLGTNFARRYLTVGSKIRSKKLASGGSVNYTEGSF